jgi:hypothetical protein
VLELFGDGADKGEDVELKEGRNGIESGEKVSLGKGLYNVMAIDEFLQGVLLEEIYEHREKVGDELAEGHSASDACAEADLQSPAVLEEVDQAPVRLLKVALSEGGSGNFLPSLTVGPSKVLPALETSQSFLGFLKKTS